MHENDHESFYKYFRMTPERFDNDADQEIAVPRTY